MLRGPWDRTGVGISDATRDSLGGTPEEMEASKAKGGVTYTGAAIRCPLNGKACCNARCRMYGACDPTLFFGKFVFSTSGPVFLSYDALDQLYKFQLSLAEQ